MLTRARLRAHSTYNIILEVILTLTCLALAGLRLFRAFALSRSLDNVLVLRLTPLDLIVIARVGRHDSTLNILYTGSIQENHRLSAVHVQQDHIH